MIREPAFFGSETSLLHDPGPQHPERPDRWRAIHSAFRDRTWRQPPSASRARLESLHTKEYVASVFAADAQLSQTGGRLGLDADTVMSRGSLSAALEAVGAAIAATEEALAGDSKRAPIAVARPPGHHAEADRAMGFCLFNNVAIAAEHALDQPGIERVLIVDWDVHHGNGTQHLFEERSDVLFVSCHRGGGFYPGTGALSEVGRGQGRGLTVNLPLAAGTGDEVFVDLFERIVVPIGRSFEPDLVLVSAGFDAHRLDPLGGLDVTGNGFGQACAWLDRLSREACGGRLALVLEGGYSLEGLVDGLSSCIEAFGSEPRNANPTSEVEALKVAHAAHWNCLSAV
ncbi:MAG: histone deacetylase [Acidobacteriota bacterium]